MKLLVMPCLLVMGITATAQIKPAAVPTETKRWFESFSIRGYVQVRYNRLLETNPKLKCEQCDRSIGESGGFIIRRGRIILSGNIAKNVFLYIQPDFGSSTGTTQNIFQIRDAYLDISFDKKKGVPPPGWAKQSAIWV